MSEMITTRILKTLDASGLEINPEVFGKLLADDGELGDYFGNSVVASADGLTVVVGAPYVNDKGPDAGSAYVFTKQTDGSYLQTQKLLAADGAVQDYFGCSVTITEDGSTVAVGAYADDDKDAYSGSVYIFTKQANGSYLQTQKLLATDGAGQDFFGWNVAITPDGSTVVIGARGDSDKGDFSGSVYVFTKQADGSYLQTQKLLAADGAAYYEFGISVAVSGDGSTIVTGATYDDDKGGNSGSAYIFTKQADGSYLETQKLITADGSVRDYFGYSVAVSGGGSTVVVGAYVFTKQANGSYLETQKLVAADGASEDQFGISVAVSGDGSTVVIGGRYDDDKGDNSGSAYIFTKQTDGSYLETQKLITADGSVRDQFGYSVAVSNTSVVIGAHGHLGKGAAYVY